jgi:hypothetical protein
MKKATLKNKNGKGPVFFVESIHKDSNGEEIAICVWRANKKKCSQEFSVKELDIHEELPFVLTSQSPVGFGTIKK